MPPLSSTIFGLTGVVTALNGASGLLSSGLAAKNAEILNISTPAMHAIALGALSLGVLFIRAAQLHDRPVMWLSVAGRALAVFVFMGDGGPWVNVAIYEGVCGVILGAALAWERFKGGKGKGKAS